MLDCSAYRGPVSRFSVVHHPARAPCAASLPPRRKALSGTLAASWAPPDWEAQTLPHRRACGTALCDTANDPLEMTKWVTFDRFCCLVPRRLTPPIPTKSKRCLTDLYDLLSKVLAFQQSEKCFGHSLDPVEHVLFEANFARLLPSG
jgi:hypothetical protein